MADKYLLCVAAGPSYDPATHTAVAVNTPNPIEISSPLCTTSLCVRVRNYRGTLQFPFTSFHHPASQLNLLFR